MHIKPSGAVAATVAPIVVEIQRGAATVTVNWPTEAAAECASPPDAAATTATLGTVSIPKAIDAILKGESLFNDATALLIFAGALAIQSNHGLDTKIVLEVVGAVPGGILFGAACALLYRWVGAPFMQSLRGSLLQFVSTYLVWIIAERLQISAVLAEVTYAMVLARNVAINTSPRNRVHSYAVWSSVVFVLNVLAFLLMGMQARVIIERTQSDLLGREFQFAGVVVAAAILTRLVVIIGSNHVAAWILRRAGQSPRGTWHQGVFAGWAGMRGLVTLATAFALPDSFPKRDLVVLTAFSVVIATLVSRVLRSRRWSAGWGSIRPAKPRKNACRRVKHLPRRL